MRKVIADLSPGRAYTVQIRSTAGDSFSEWSPNFTIGPYNKVALPPEIVSSDIVISTIDDKFFANWTYGAIQNDFNNYEYKWAYWNGTEYVDSTTVYSTLLAPGIFTSSNINLPLTSQTVSVTDASTLPTSGTVYIAGTAVAYTSKSGNDLVGCTASGTGTLTAPQGVVTTLSGNPSSGNAELDYATNLKLFTSARPNISISVRTVDTTGNKSGWVRSANFATNPAPGKPMSVSLSGSTDTISATWLAPSTDKDLKSYNIYVYRASTPSTVDQVVKATHIESTSSLAQSAQISFTDTEARKIKIKSVDKFDQESAESDNTVLVAATAPNIEEDLKTAIASWSRDAGGTVTIQTVTPHGLKIYSPQSISAVSASVSGVRTITLSSSPVFSVTDRVEITGLTTASLNENVVVLSILGSTFTYKSSDTDSGAITGTPDGQVLARDWVMISDSSNGSSDCNTLEGAPVKVVSVASGVDPVVFTCIPDPTKLSSVASGSTGYVSHTGNIVKINKGSINVGNLESHNLVAIYPTSFTLRSGFEGQRIAITSAGITGYRTGNDPTVRIGNDGTFFLKSSVSGNRVELDGDNGLRVKDSDNNTIVKVDTTGLEGYSKPISISSISAMSASISSITLSSGATYSTPVTYASSNEGSFTYTAGNIFTAGQKVNISGFTTNTAYNLSNAVVSGSDGSTFTVGAGLVTYPITAYSTIAEDGTVTFTVSGSFVLAEGDLVSISDSITGYNLKNATVLSTTATTFTLSFPGAPDTGSTATSGTVYKLEKSESSTSATASYPGSTYIKTVTTTAAHNFPVGSLVTVGVDINAPILSSPTATTFTYLSLSSNVSYSNPASINGYRKLVTGADHGLKPGQLFRITGTTDMNEEPVEVSDVISNNTLTYKTQKTGTFTVPAGQIAKETFSININNGASSFGGEIKSSSYSTYSLTGSKLSISENDGLKLTRETVQNFILNPTFSNELDFPYSEHWASVASYGLPVVNSGQSDSGMGQLTGVNSFKSSPIKITSITNTTDSLEKTVTTSMNHGLASPDRVALNGIVYGSITPSSINYKETVSSVTSSTQFKYTPEIGKNAFYITSITTSGTTKTVNTSVAHNFVPGQNVWITGTSNSNLNNSSVTIVLTPTTTSFTYVGPDSTSTASDTVTTVTAATKLSGTYTFTSANTYSPGETVTISGVNSNYNITGTIVTANGTQFTMSGSGSASDWSKVVNVTSATGLSSYVTYATTNNDFRAGDTVTIAGLSTGFNLNNVTIATAGVTSFTVTTNTLSGQSWSNTSKVSAAISNGTDVTYTVPLGHGVTNGSTISITGTSSVFNLSSQFVTGTTETSFSVTPWIGAPAAGAWDNTWKISSAEITAGQIEYTTTSAHQLTAGGLATISNASSSYNITNVAITAASGTTFTVATANSAVAWKNTVRIESATGNGSVITYTTSNPHGFYNGQYVTVSGLNASYNVSGTISGASGNVFSISSTATTSPTSWQRTLYPTAWSYTSPDLTLTVPNLFSAGNQVYVDGLPTSVSASTSHGNMSIASTTLGQIVLNIGTGQTVITKIISYNPTATASTTVASGSNAVNISTFAGSGTLNVASTSAFASSGTINVYATPSGGAARAFPITYTGKTGTTFTGCNSSGANAVLATSNVVAISTSTISFPLSSNTTIPSSSVLSSTGWPTTGFFVIMDSGGINHLVSYGGISGQSFTNCNSLDSISGTVNAYANIKQQPRIRLNGRFSTQQVGATKTTITISSASYDSATGLRTYTTATAHGLTVGDPVDVTGLTGTNSSEYNIVEGTIKSVTTSTPFTFVVYAPSPTSAATSSLTGQAGAYTSHASKVRAEADVTVTGTSTNNGTATVAGGTASTTAAVGTVSPSGAISTSSISASFTNSSISSFSSSRRGALTTPVYLPNSASKAATGSFWIYQNVETSGLYLNMKDFILDDSTTPIPASTNGTTFSQIIPKGSWTRISNIFNLPSSWGPSSTLKLPTLLYADKSFSVTNISGTGIGSRTVTTSDNHNFEQYQTVTISGAAPGFNETATIVTIPSPNTFTYNSNVSGSHSPAYFPKATSKSVQVNAVAYYDGTMLTLTNGLTEYFDGDHQGKWQGVKGDSVSVKESFTSGQIRLRAGSNISAGEGNYLSEMDKISFSSALPQKVSPSIAPISLDIYDSILGYLPPQTGVALYSGSDTVGKSAYVGVTTDGTTGILTLGGISKIQGNPYFTDVRTVYRQGSSTVYNTSGTYAFLNYGSPATYFGNIPFTVPASGQCIIDYGSNYYLVSSASAGASIYLALSISTTINAGVTVLWDERNSTGPGAASSRVLVAQIDTGSSSSIDTAVRSSFSRRHVFYGTPGQTYYAQLSSKGSGGTYQITIPQIIITPVLAKI